MSGRNFGAAESASEKTQFEPENALPPEHTQVGQHSYRQPQITSNSKHNNSSSKIHVCVVYRLLHWAWSSPCAWSIDMTMDIVIFYNRKHPQTITNLLNRLYENTITQPKKLGIRTTMGPNQPTSTTWYSYSLYMLPVAYAYCFPCVDELTRGQRQNAITQYAIFIYLVW